MGSLFTLPISYLMYAVRFENDCYVAESGCGDEHCLWINDTLDCVTIHDYCSGTTNYTASQIKWPETPNNDDGDGFAPRNCTEWIIAFTISMLFCTLLCCITPWCYCIREVRKGNIQINAKEQAILILSFICMMGISLTCVIMTFSNNDFELYRQIWCWSGFTQYLVLLAVTAVIYFGMRTYHIIRQLIFYGKKTVHSMLLVFIYISYWVVLFIFIAIIPYFIVSKDITGLQYGALFALLFDLWHPVQHIQNNPSNAVIKRYFGADTINKCCDCVIQKLCPRIHDSYVVLNERNDISTDERKEQGNAYDNEENKYEIEDEKHDEEHNSAKEMKECNLQYWQFIGFTLYIGVFVTFSLIFEKYESCLLSWAAFLPTFINILMFIKHEKLEFGHKKYIGCFICVLSFAFLIFCLLVTFTILSCTCIYSGSENEDVCEWPHIGVDVTVLLFVCCHLHQKRYCKHLFVRLEK
eukprot:528093_1